ncbi:hypothetical protein D3C73_1463900 [compost metagenome]
MVTAAIRATVTAGGTVEVMATAEALAGASDFLLSDVFTGWRQVQAPACFLVQTGTALTLFRMHAYIRA